MEGNMAAINYLEHNFPNILKYPLQNKVKIMNMVGLNKDLKMWNAECDMIEIKQHFTDFPWINLEPNVKVPAQKQIKKQCGPLWKCDVTFERSRPTVVKHRVKKQNDVDLHKQLQSLYHGQDLVKVLRWPFDRGKPLCYTLFLEYAK